MRGSCGARNPRGAALRCLCVTKVDTSTNSRSTRIPRHIKSWDELRSTLSCLIFSGSTSRPAVSMAMSFCGPVVQAVQTTSPPKCDESPCHRFTLYAHTGLRLFTRTILRTWLAGYPHFPALSGNPRRLVSIRASHSLPRCFLVRQCEFPLHVSIGPGKVSVSHVP